MKHHLSSTVVLFALSFLLFCQCNRNHGSYQQFYGTIITGHTSGTISRAQPIRIEFKEGILREDIEEQELQRAFSITPQLDGTIKRRGDQIIVFEAKELLPSATEFVVQLQLAQLVKDTLNRKASFDFEFKTTPQDVAVELSELLVAASTPDEMEATLLVSTADVMTIEELKALLKVTYAGAAITPDVINPARGTQHLLRLSNLKKSVKSSVLEVYLDASKWGNKKSFTTQFELPAIGSFFVFDTRTELMGEPHVVVTLSNPLPKGINMEGLVTIMPFPGGYKFLVQDNILRIYATSPMNGDYMLILDEGLKDIKGTKLNASLSYPFTISPPNPAVRFTDQGNIIPSSSGQFILPIEAIHLNSVDIEVTKIFASNVLQYLQMDDYESEWNMHRVGRMIKRKTIVLTQGFNEQNTGNWQRYGLDIGELIAEDKNALYEIRIGFRPEHSTLSCGLSINTQAPADLAEMDEDFSMFDSYYGWEEDWYDGYWKDRDDPCKKAYYNPSRFISRVFYTSSIGMIAKAGVNGDFQVICTHLKDAKPAGSVQVKLFDFQQQLIQEGTTNSDGIFQIRSERKVAFVVATYAGSNTYLSVKEGYSLQMSRFDVSGLAPQKGIKGYLYGERAVWRPGDSLFLNYIVEGDVPGINLPAPMCELYDPEGRLVKRYGPSRQIGPIYDISTSTHSEAVTGNYTLKVKHGGALFTRQIKIETIKPNRLKINLKVPEISSNDNSISGQLEAEWLHGAPGSNMNAEIVASRMDYMSGFEKFRNYRFLDPARKGVLEEFSIFKSALDDKGKASVKFPLTLTSPPAGKQLLKLATTVYEPGGDFSIDYQQVLFSPFSKYVGLALPQDPQGSQRMDLNKTSQGELIVVDESGNPVSNQWIDIGIYQVEWKWWWDSYDDYVYGFASSTHNNALYTQTVKTDGSGKAKLPLQFTQWGRYLIRACIPTSGHCTGDFINVGYPYYEDSRIVNDQATLLSIQTDKSTYQPGQFIQMNLPLIAKGNVLVSIENGSGIIASKWYPVIAGDNTLKIPVQENFAPNIYLHVTYIQPHDEMAKELPLRMYGILSVQVENIGSRLQPKLTTPAELEGDQTFVLEVAEANSQEMYYTIAIVDEGLLDITKFKTPDPHQYFFAKEALGVRTWDFYDRILSNFKGGRGRILSIGGDAAIQIEGTPKPNRFPPVVMHAGPFKLEKGRKQKHQFKMPNYSGSVKVMIVAADHKKYGFADATIKVRKSLMVLPTLPRVLSIDETLDIPVSVFSLEQKVKQATVSVQEKGNMVSFPKGTQFKVDFSKAGEELIRIPMKVGSIEGTATLQFEIKGGKHTSQHSLQIQIRNPNPRITSTLQDQVAGGTSKNLTIPIAKSSKPQSIILEVSRVPSIQLGERLKYLIDYPYGCTEQVISAAFPQLFVQKIATLTQDQERRSTYYVQEALRRLQQITDGSGKVSNWPQGSHHDWVSTYATHFVSEANKAGYIMNIDINNKLIGYQSDMARQWVPKKFESDQDHLQHQYQLQQAYRLFVLAGLGKAELGAMNLFREQTNLHAISKTLLAGAYAYAGRRDVGNQLIKNLDFKWIAYEDPGETYGGRLRDKGLALQALQVLDAEVLKQKVLKELVEEVNGYPWFSTQSLAQAIIGYVSCQSDIPTDPMSFTFEWDGKTRQVTLREHTLMISIPPSTNSPNTLRFTNSSSHNMFVKIAATHIPPPGTEASMQEQLVFTIQYETREGAPLDVSKLVQGTDFYARVTLQTGNLKRELYKNMAISQIFPSGWEIINERLYMGSTEGSTTNSYLLYQDIRDDRVFTIVNMHYRPSITYRIPLKATYSGRYYLPLQKAEQMYSDRAKASIKGQWIEVLPVENRAL